MKSRILDSIKTKSFIPFPDKCFYNMDESDNILRKFGNKTLSELKNESYSTWKFSGHDTYKEYVKNLKKIKDWYYKDNSVTYTLNSFGYRTKQFDEVDWANSIVIFGCSLVVGIGVDDKHTISSFLEKEIGIPIINMGIAGGSNMMHIHNSNVLFETYPTPKAVIYSWSPLPRYFRYSWNHINLYGNWSEDQRDFKKNQYDCMIRNVVSMHTMKNIWKNKTVLIDYSTDCVLFDFIKNLSPDPDRYFIDILGSSKRKFPDDFARDLSHYSKDHNYKVAKKLAAILRSHMIQK